MGYSKKILILVLILILGFPAAWADTQAPDRIKIGLVYNNPEQATLQLSGYGEIGFGTFSGTDFNEITRFAGVKDITVSKDYAWHIRIGDSAGDWGQYDALRQTVSADVPFAAPYYEKGWNLMVGDFLSEAEALSLLSILQSQYPGLDMTVMGPSPDRVRVLSGQQLIWTYHANEAEYAFKEVAADPYLKYNGVAYRGGMIIRRFSGSDLTLINTVTLNEYLYGVLPKEMAADWPLEALKAQAVAARNYAVTAMGKHKSRGFDLCATADCQVYGGYRVESPLCRQAVDETTDRFLMYDGKLVQAFFHSNSGGKTENSENVWSAAVPYLKGVEDTYSVGAPNTNWTKAYTKSEIEQKLIANQINIGSVVNVTVSRKSENDRVLDLLVQGSMGDVTLTKEQSRKVLGYNDLKSTWFDVSGGAMLRVQQDSGLTDLPAAAVVVDGAMETSELVLNGMVARTINGDEAITTAMGDAVTFTGHGWGHGLGLSQWGAKNMAEQGFTYEQILLHYYTGTTLQ